MRCTSTTEAWATTCRRCSAGVEHLPCLPVSVRWRWSGATPTTPATGTTTTSTSTSTIGFRVDWARLQPAATSYPQRPPARIRGTARTVQRVDRDRHRPQRHHVELRLVDRYRRGRALQIDLTILDNANGCVPCGAAVYLWHCTREGAYSLYSDGVTGENYLRGVQEADADGKFTFTSIFPGAYSGRWPHIHFEVYSSLDEATSAGPISATSQIALPQESASRSMPPTATSRASRTWPQSSLQSDMVFSDDGGVRQLATMTGSVPNGLTATLSVPV